MTILALEADVVTSSVTRQDVVRCYEKILRRSPENDGVVEDHLRRSGSVIDLVETLFFSPENQDRLRRTEALSIDKCSRAQYLAKAICLRTKRRFFLHHHTTLDSLLTDDALDSLLASSILLCRITETLSIVVRQSIRVVEEGELSIELHENEMPIYTLAFTFIPSLRDTHAHTAILISRMQGQAGCREALRAATRVMEDVSPQAILFAAVIGVAEASNISTILGVSAHNHIWSREEDCEIYTRAYDRFYQNLGYSQDEKGFYRVSLPLIRKSLKEIKACHRSRASAKRRFKDDICKQISSSWRTRLLASTRTTDASGTPTSQA